MQWLREEFAPQRVKARRQERARLRAACAAREKRDETRELLAQSLACLIEAYVEMRPYVGTET